MGQLVLVVLNPPAGYLERSPGPDGPAAAAAGGDGLIPLRAAALSTAKQPAATLSTCSSKGR
jgi:hypothetical protein